MLADFYKIVVQIQFTYHFKGQTFMFQLGLKRLKTFHIERENVRNINYPEFRIATNLEGSAIKSLCFYCLCPSTLVAMVT